MSGLYRNAFHSGRQNTVAIFLRLRGKQLVTRHTYRSRANSSSFKFLLRVNDQPDLRSARHENNLRRATRRIGEDIGSLRESGSRCVFLPVYEGELLTRK